MTERTEKPYKRFKPEEIQHVPAFNYYASKEELVNAIRESDKRLHQALEKMDAKIDQENKELRQELKNDFRWLAGIMITGFITMIGLYFRVKL